MNNPWPVARKRSKVKYNTKREAVLHAAAKLVRERGAEATLLSDIAESLNITHPTLYYYYKSKEELLFAVKQRAQEEAIAFIQTARYLEARGVEKLRQMLVKYSLLMTSDIGRCLTAINHVTMLETSRRELESNIKRAEQSIFAMIDQAIEEGDLQVEDRVVAYHYMFGAMHWLPYWFNSKGRLSAQRIAEMLADLILNGLRTPERKRIPKKSVIPKSPRKPRRSNRTRSA